MDVCCVWCCMCIEDNSGLALYVLSLICRTWHKLRILLARTDVPFPLSGIELSISTVHGILDVSRSVLCRSHITDRHTQGAQHVNITRTLQPHCMKVMRFCSRLWWVIGSGISALYPWEECRACSGDTHCTLMTEIQVISIYQ